MAAVKSFLIALLRERDAAPRWPYFLSGFITLLFIGHAYEDGGLGSAPLYVGIIALSVWQTIRPSVLGWFLLFAPFLWYGVDVATSPGNGPFSEWVIFWFLVSCLFWHCSQETLGGKSVIS